MGKIVNHKIVWVIISVVLLFSNDDINLNEHTSVRKRIPNILCDLNTIKACEDWQLKY